MNILLIRPVTKSQVMLDSALVLLRNNASISHLSEQISSVQSILLTLSQANNENTVDDEMQIARQYRMPGGIDLVGGFQETGTGQFGRNTRSVSMSKLVEWLCQLQCCLVFLRWLHFQWSFSLKFEISLATPSRNVGGSRTWAVLIGIDTYGSDNFGAYYGTGSVADALLMQKYAIEHLGVPEGRIQLLTSSHHISSAGLSPTHSNIVKTLSSLIASPDIHHGDEIIIYYSGFGTSYSLPDSSYSYTDAVAPRRRSGIVALCPMDRENSLDISDREISTILHLISSNKKARITLILDCCHAGAFSRNPPQPGPRGGSLWRQQINMLNEGHNTLKSFPGYQSILQDTWSANTDSYVLLAACQEFQNAMSSTCVEESGGVFTRALVETLTSGDLKEKSTFMGLMEALRPLMPHTQTPIAIGKYRDAPISVP
ncbi:caspase domain-containing protein [Armillaria borealis]|uniref:Caspase domain-containing protein n=1 Tax=Armillaria borealis TaxID=47425 RepID=A0AA39IWB0_9AGAR|nr:caspase domain-containing protein [Armillaria borealis]